MSLNHDRKPVFDVVRTMLRRGFRQSEVDRLDDALGDALGDGPETGPEARADGPARFSPLDSVSGVSGVSGVPLISKARQPQTALPTRIGTAGTALIKRFEGCARLRRDGLVEAYPDPGTGAEPWTIGWGATGPDLDGQGRIGPGTTWTQAQCDARLESDLQRYASDVARAIGDTPTTQAQFDALVSFHYNTGAIYRATLTRKHIAGDHAGAAAEFARWNRAGGRVLKGLVRRRAEEARLYAA
ncbi:lysozyme [Qipengyuania sp. ASV99]|uniref:lysozyme n=1 Tax=Qipengyuania sp. ASV99 TaxID=3399681 RepID=UPI003A4C73C5